jgi:hypothetical protein
MHISTLSPELLPQNDLNLPEPPQDMPVRPVTPVSWEVVERHFRPWVEAWQARPESQEERLARKVDVPFEM